MSLVKEVLKEHQLFENANFEFSRQESSTPKKSNVYLDTSVTVMGNLKEEKTNTTLLPRVLELQR